jgi:hypothetical protein
MALHDIEALACGHEWERERGYRARWNSAVGRCAPFDRDSFLVFVEKRPVIVL